MAKKAKIKKGFAFHVHHKELMEWCYDFDGRAQIIKKNKPKNEVKPRLKWMRFVKGKLPNAVIETGTALDRAKVAYDKTWAIYNKTRACDKAVLALDKARTTYYEVETACYDAIYNNKSAIEKLHAKECPDCTWNGNELIF